MTSENAPNQNHSQQETSTRELASQGRDSSLPDGCPPADLNTSVKRRKAK